MQARISDSQKVVEGSLLCCPLLLYTSAYELTPGLRLIAISIVRIVTIACRQIRGSHEPDIGDPLAGHLPRTLITGKGVQGVSVVCHLTSVGVLNNT